MNNTIINSLKEKRQLIPVSLLNVNLGAVLVSNVQNPDMVYKSTSGG